VVNMEAATFAGMPVLGPVIQIWWPQGRAAPEMVGHTSYGCWRMMAATSAGAGADDVSHLWPRRAAV
jgi:hypothetical protein